MQQPRWYHMLTFIVMIRDFLNTFLDMEEVCLNLLTRFKQPEIPIRGAHFMEIWVKDYQNYILIYWVNIVGTF